MKRLILMRHAKSDWTDLDQTDHGRALNERGRVSAAALGDWLRKNGFQPDHILCSDAKRTRETLDGLKLGDAPTSFLKSLYLAEPDVMAGTLHQRSEDCILMVAHNPGTAMLAEMLLATASDHSGFYKYPTGATLVVDFDIMDWRDLRKGTGKLVQFTVPRDLMK
ncbi:SixA phosphatase family protein [Sulfitobacter donghicola]|uniref:Phosphoglycerate mutase n=1 Tax=Sulfitobacter donghicola DSW-25 = KCTC 12864 = JCM 14565 TaxID=1300350 RepID=A0A073ITC9_9RHOB|nr:histidine phosphatase family protein [Sulfitobacter donghicola]KEJ88662.1 phosphoglycerate mutase [Sulfitobacter donghicola DSW-25 = KCTC 12864 = JCM 14565]KIN68430.1 Phosphogylcerate mutase-like protein [Sulfitobacter donghicola DSW-25 = KCTC 12864 = JCM 14565]